MRGIYLFILTLYPVMFPAAAQQTGGARSMAMGGASAALSNDAWVVWTNPGGFGQLHAPEVAFTLAPKPFGVSELSSASLALALPLIGGTAGLAGRSFGSDLYREITTTVGWGILTDGIGIGAALHATWIRIERYGSATVPGVDLGCIVFILENLRWGLSIDNANAPVVGRTGERLPRDICTGMAYFPVNDLCILLDMEKTPGFEPSLRLGLEARLHPEFTVRAGMAGVSNSFSLGMGVRVLAADVDIASFSHSDLGWSHAVTAGFRWGTDHE